MPRRATSPPAAKPTPLKELLNPAAVRALATTVAAVEPSFDAPAFTAQATRGLAALELAARARHIADALHAHLPQPFARAGRVLLASLGPAGDGATMRYWPHTCFVQTYGLAVEDFELAMQLQRELTRRFTAEWSIRPFLLAHPARTYAQLERWATDADVHVRRLVSEGTRPRLPWTSRLTAYVRDPAPVLALLERLVDDPERFVQRSVANSLGDIAKDHPALAIATGARWLRAATPSRTWVVRHGLRLLIKQGEPGALALIGAGAAPEVDVVVRALPGRVRMGDAITVELDVTSTGAAAQTLEVDLAVHYVKADGSRRPKVFKLRRLALAPGTRIALRRRLSFADLSTRTHYPGVHLLELRVNGEARPLGEVDVRR